MSIEKRCSNRRIVLLISMLISISLLYYYHSVIKTRQPFIPHVRPQLIQHTHLKKVSIAHYTTTYGTRTDSRSNVLSANLNHICNILDPEEYPYADSVVVSLVDFARFPPEKELYRKKHQSQLWILHTEESPRNSYRTAQIHGVTELDDWFNLTTTLKPESDIQIQYKGYRLKPAIVNLLSDKLKIHFNHTGSSKFRSQSQPLINSTSAYLNSLAIVLQKEFNDRHGSHAKTCPYTCNQPLSPALTQSLQPYLQPIIPRSSNRETVYIAWFVSNCDSHSGREEFVLKLRSQPGIRVDIYGYCSSIFNSHIVPVQCQKGTPNCMEKTLSNYRFYLSFENSKCDTYITEKYWMQGLNGQAIPIVLGAKREHYERIAIPNSYIHVDNYQTVEDLARELLRLNRNDSAYTQYLQWTQIYDVAENYSPTGQYGTHSTLCFLGHYQRLHAMKENLEQRDSLLQRIRDIFSIGNVSLANFDWQTARTKLVRISEFYNPKVNCWDNDYPSFPRRAWNFLFTWWKFF